MMGIYAIRGPNDAVYVGKAKNIKKRWGQHRSHLRSGVHGTPHLQYAWNKYGETAFVFEIVELVDSQERMIVREQFWLDTLFGTMPKGTVYNHATFSQGGGHTKGRKNNDRQIQALIDANKRRIWTPEMRAESARVRTGLKQSRSTIDKRTAKSRGQKRTEEQLTNRVLSRTKGNKYTIISPDGTVYQNIVLVGIFANEHGLDGSSLRKMLKGRFRHTKGWTGYLQTKEHI